LSDLTLILLAAGDSSRFRSRVKKQWIRIGDRPLWQHVADRFIECARFARVVITGHPDEIEYMRLHGDYTVVGGGSSRQASLQHALAFVETPYIMVTDVARGCVDIALIDRLIAARENAD